MKIETISLGLPTEQATDLLVRVMPFDTDATTCGLYYSVTSESGNKLAEGNLQLTAEEFDAWGQSNSYIDDLALSKLGLTRKEI